MCYSFQQPTSNIMLELLGKFEGKHLQREEHGHTDHMQHWYPSSCIPPHYYTTTSIQCQLFCFLAVSERLHMQLYQDSHVSFCC